MLKKSNKKGNQIKPNAVGEKILEATPKNKSQKQIKSEDDTSSSIKTQTQDLTMPQ